MDAWGFKVTAELLIPSKRLGKKCFGGGAGTRFNPEFFRSSTLVQREWEGSMVQYLFTCTYIISPFASSGIDDRKFSQAFRHRYRLPS